MLNGIQVRGLARPLHQRNSPEANITSVAEKILHTLSRMLWSLSCCMYVCFSVCNGAESQRLGAPLCWRVFYSVHIARRAFGTHELSLRLQPLYRLSLEEKKKLIRSNIDALVKAGILPSDDPHQQLVNLIAQDIRYQRRYRQSRKQDLLKLRSALDSLASKRAFFESQVDYYNQYVRACLDNLNTQRRSVIWCCRTALLPGDDVLRCSVHTGVCVCVRSCMPASVRVCAHAIVYWCQSTHLQALHAYAWCCFYCSVPWLYIALRLTAFSLFLCRV